MDCVLRGIFRKNIIIGTMVLDCDIDDQWPSEVNHLYDNVYHKFEVAHDALEEAQEKVEYCINYLWSPSEQVKKAILEKITYIEWCATVDALEICIEDFDKYISLIDRGLESFEILMDLSTGNVDEMVLEIAEKVVELFISVHIETEDQMKKVQEIIEKIGIPSLMDES